MMALDLVADRQAQWSTTANTLKATIDRTRWFVLALSVLGALAAALASQLAPPPENTAVLANPRTWMGGFGAACLVAVTFFTGRMLAGDHIASWVRARAISERLKREGYRFAAGAAPYDVQATAEALLDAERETIEKDGDDMLDLLVKAADQGGLPRTAQSQDDYITKRVKKQIAYFTDKSERHATTAKWLRRAEFCLALTATLITGAASVTGKSAPILGVQFDFAAFTAVLTSLASAILAHVEASRLDFLVTTFRATARRLQDRLRHGQAPWSSFVNDCENILAAENTSWIAKWTKDAPAGAPGP